MELKILIAEDSQENIDTLVILLEEYGIKPEALSIAKTIKEAEEKLLSEKFDLALLDIQFKKGTIFEVLDKLVHKSLALPEIVFVTAHGSYEYATKAIQFACLDFINKPVDPLQLKQVIEKYKTKFKSEQDQKKQVKLLLDLLEGDIKAPETVAVILPKNRMEFIKIDELLYITADGNTCQFHLSGKTFNSTRHLGYYIDIFDDNPNILQISRACIVNRKNVKEFNASNREMIMNNDEKLTVSHRAAKHIKSSLLTNQSFSIQASIEKIKRLLS